MQPKVSVFLPTYQQRDLLRQSLDSVLIQDYENIEIVVGDDGSTDGTQEMLLDYQDRYPHIIKLILSETNTGITGNCNRIYSACTGEYIAIIGGDDLWLPGKLHKQVKWFNDNPGAAICYTNVEIFDSDSGKAYGLHHEPHRNKLRSGGVEQFFVSAGFFIGSSAMVRSSACPQYGFDTRLKQVSDWLFFVETARNGSIGYVPDVLTRYRIHSNNISKNRDLLLYEQLLALGIAEAKYPDLVRLTRNSRSEILWFHGFERLRAGKYDLACVYFNSSFGQKTLGPKHLKFSRKLLIYVLTKSNMLPVLTPVLKIMKK